MPGHICICDNRVATVIPTDDDQRAMGWFVSWHGPSTGFTRQHKYVMDMQIPQHRCGITLSGGRFKNADELLNLRALKFSPVNKMYIFQCMGKIFWCEFQRVPMKYHNKYLTHVLKYAIFLQRGNFKSSWIQERMFWNVSHHEVNHPLKSGMGFWLDKIPH